MDGVLTSSRSLRLPLAVAVVLSGLAVAVAARVVTSRVAARAMPAGLAAFRLKAPAGAVASPSKDDDTVLLTVRLARGASVLVARFPGEDPDPRAGVERMRAGISNEAGDPAQAGRTRRTRVGGIDAYAADVTFGSGTLLREFRFAHAGQLWGIGVLVRQDEPAALDTALAMVASFRFAA